MSNLVISQLKVTIQTSSGLRDSCVIWFYQRTTWPYTWSCVLWLWVSRWSLPHVHCWETTPGLHRWRSHHRTDTTSTQFCPLQAGAWSITHSALTWLTKLISLNNNHILIIKKLLEWKMGLFAVRNNVFWSLLVTSQPIFFVIF